MNFLVRLKKNWIFPQKKKNKSALYTVVLATDLSAIVAVT